MQSLNTDLVVGLPNQSAQEEPSHKKRTRRSDVAFEERSLENTSKEHARHSTRGQGSTTVLKVEAATSSYAKDRSKSRKRDEIVDTAELATTGLSKSSKRANTSAKSLGSSVFQIQGKNSRQESKDKGGSQKQKKGKALFKFSIHSEVDHETFLPTNTRRQTSHGIFLQHIFFVLANNPIRTRQR